ncbi:MAG: PEP-CTERM sorting domain-containing protein [Chroococcidiopsidaceae cyanobacterium CP_BM_ER_R8_30]|nr:PEP-CTERM sorting domain-containing protein [Chroococcidiopsidaceae cyanobacterium CP_BM_ER_R8_30]
MYRKLANAAIALVISSSVLMAAASAKAATFTFSLGGFGGGNLSGSFTGTPESSGDIFIGDLAAFSATSTSFSPPLALSLTDLQIFSYSTATGLLQFNAFNSIGTISVGSGSINGTTGTVSEDGRSFNSSSSIAVAQVPEPSEVGGLYLVGLVGIGGLIKRKWCC